MRSASQIWCLIILVLTTLASFIVAAEETTYILALLGQSDRRHASHTNVTYNIVLTNPARHEVHVNVTGKSGLIHNFTIPPEGYYSMDLDSTHALYGSRHRNKSYIFHSNQSFTLQTFVHNHKTRYTEGFLGVPFQQLLGPYFPKDYYEYLVATYCGMGGYCQFAIAALEDKTSVSVTLPSSVEPIKLCIRGRKFDTSRSTYLSINRYFAAQFESTMDLSGTRIFSKKPIVVFVGARNITHNGVTAHLIEQLQTSSQFGIYFLVKSITSRRYGRSIVKIAANWANTTVNIQGYPTFRISDSSHVITKRLPDDVAMEINASKPIQVMQISGILGTMSTKDFSPSMVLQPPKYTRRTLITGFCNDTATFLIHTKDLFYFTYFATFKWPISSSEVFNKSGMMLVNRTMKASGYFSLNAIGGILIGGVMQCGPSTIMSLNVQRPPQNTSSPVADKEEKVSCDEGLEANLTEEFRPHNLDISEYRRIRVLIRSCGKVILRFGHHPVPVNTSLGEYVLIEVSMSKLMLTTCGVKCQMKIVRRNITKGFNCSIDMSAVTFNISGNQICISGNPFYSRSHSCVNTTTPNRLTIMSTYKQAYILYDLENENCTRRKSGKPNSRGRKFYFTLPLATSHSLSYYSLISDCSIYTMSALANAITYVGYDNEVLLAARVNDRYTRYDCKPYYRKYTKTKVGTLTVISNIDVTVNVFIMTSLRHPVMFSVYPVDTFSTSYVPFTIFGNYSRCYIVSPEENDIFVDYFDASKVNNRSSKLINAKPGQPYVLGYSTGYVGRYINGSKPLGVFCGTEIDSKSRDQSFYQLQPEMAIGKTFRTPTIGFLNIPINVSIIVKPADNEANVTVFNSKENSTHNVKGTLTKMIQTNFVYNIESNSSISVGLLFRGKSGQHQFMPIPSTKNYDRGSVLAFPLDELRNNIYAVSEITTYLKCDGKTLPPAKPPNNKKMALYTVRLPDKPCLTVSLLTGSNRWYLLPGPWVIPDTREKKILKDVCMTSTPVVGDHVDNDCDGFVDEETCGAGKDSDMDGAFNEDCATVVNASTCTTVQQPKEPNCHNGLNQTMDKDGYGCWVACKCSTVQQSKEPICHKSPTINNQTMDKDSYGCWVPCKCPCSWKTNLETFNKLSNDEKDQFGKDSDDKYRKLLQVEKEQLSKTRNTKLSIPDERVSSKYIGYSGISLFVCFLATIIILDMRAIIHAVFVFWANLKGICGCKCKKLKRRRSRVEHWDGIELSGSK